MKKIPFFPAEEPGATASIVDSCVLFCNLIVTGKETAIAIKYDEENMFAPMIVLIEKDASSGALVQIAERLGVPVIKNISLAKNLAFYGKAGDPIPETSYRDVSAAFARLGRSLRQNREVEKSRQGIPVTIPRPLSIEMGETLFALSGEEPGRKELLSKPLNAIRKKLMRLLGISIPSFRIFVNPKLKTDEYRIMLKGLEAGRGRLELGWYAAAPDAAIPEMMNNPENIRAVARAASSLLVSHADEIIQKRAPELLGRDEVEAILDAAEEKYPVVTGEVKSLLSLGIIRDILQGLVSEKVSIRHIAIILETLADWGSFGATPNDMIIEQIRQSLKRQICLDYADDRFTLRVLTLEPELEKSFTDFPNAYVTDADNPGPIAADQVSEDWVDIISSAAKGMEEKGFPPVILCSPSARSHVKEATRRKFPNLAVLSYLEIPSDISVEPVGEIRSTGSVRF